MEKKSRGEPSAAVTVSFICRCFDIAHIRNSLVPLFYWNSQVQMCLWVIRIEESNARRSWHTHNLLQRIFNFLPKHLLLQTISYLVIGFFLSYGFFRSFSFHSPFSPIMNVLDLFVFVHLNWSLCRILKSWTNKKQIY